MVLTPTSDPDSVYWWDFTGATDWTAEKLSDTKFRVRIEYDKGGGAANPAYLDWIPVRVTHPAPSVTDVNDLTPDFVAPGQTNVPLMEFTVNEGSNNHKFKEVEVRNEGTLAAIASLSLFKESGEQAGFQADQDAQIATDDEPSGFGDFKHFNLNPEPDFDIGGSTDPGGSDTLYIVANVKPTALTGNKIDVKIETNKIELEGHDFGPYNPNDPSDYSTVDATAPSAPTLQSPANDASTNVNTPAFNWTDVTDPSGVTYTLQVSTDGFSTFVINQAGITSSDFTSSTLLDDTYSWRVRAVDGVGNVGAFSSTFTVTVDTGNPTVSITYPADGSYLGTASFTVTGTSADTGGSGVDKVEVQIDGEPYADATGTTSWTYDVSSLSDGPHTITAKATDNVGNSLTTSVTITVTVPTWPPEPLLPPVNVTEVRGNADAILSLGEAVPAGDDPTLMGLDYNGDGFVDIADAFDQLVDVGLLRPPSWTFDPDAASQFLAALESVYGENLVNFPSVEGRVWLLYMLTYLPYQ